MKDIDVESEIFKRMLVLVPELIQSNEKFNSTFGNLWSRSNQSLDTIVRCHLILESFLTKYIESKSRNIFNVKEARLSFNQKVGLIKDSEPILRIIYPGINDLNKVRNKLVHDLDYEIKEEFSNIARYVNAWQSALGASSLAGTDLIFKFTQLACAHLHNPELSDKVKMAYRVET